MSALNSLRGHPWALRAGGLVLGAALVFLLPSSWLFMPAEGLSVASKGDGTRYACPMFCVIMDELPENERCPVCGMALQVVADQATLDRHERFMSGVIGEALEERPLEVVLRQIGEVDYDETLLSTVTARVSGFLERVHVQETWAAVQAGQVLVEIDSPALFSAQGDYLVAWNAAGRPQDPQSLEGPAAAGLRATRTRLLNLGLGEDELLALREQGTPLDPVALRAPRSGLVARRRVVEGEGVMAGQELFAIADLSRVWILFEVFEHELTRVVKGQEVELRTETEPGKAWTGLVDRVDPVVDRVRRTARVRVVADNPEGEGGRRLYLPGQRVDVRLRGRLGRKAQVVLPDLQAADPYAAARPLLSIPREAVLRTGDRDIAFVLYEEVASDRQHIEAMGDEAATARSYDLDPEALPDRVGYELVQLRLGPRARESGIEDARWYYPVLGVVPREGEAGLLRLRPGHVIAADGAFLLDSQAQLAGRPSLLFPEGSRSMADDPHANH